MAKSKKRKVKKKPAQQVKIKPANYIKKHARKLPIHECLIQDNWKDANFTPMVISRKRANGNIVAATYIVDLTCLGVKDTSFIYDIDPYSYQENIKGMEQGMNVTFIKIAANLAHNIIYGAVEFAEDCGIEPHKDFTNITEYILDPVESVDYIEVHFGDEDGKPYYFAGPYDDSKKIIATLRKTVGEGNFNYTMPFGNSMDNNFTGDKPFMSKQEILDTFLPDEKVNEKIKNFELENHKAAYIPQIICTSMILEEVEGQLHLLEAAYYEEQDNYLTNVLRKLARSYAASQKVAIEEIEDEVLDELDNLIIFLTEKLIEFGSTDFLFEKSYIPIPRVVSNEELAKMNEEELDAHEAHRLFYMTNVEKYHHTISQYAYYFLSVNYKETDFTVEGKREAAIQQFLEDVQKQAKEPLFEQQLEDYKASCNGVIDHYFLGTEEA